MKRFFQIVTVLLAIGALIQTAVTASATDKSGDSTQGGQGGGGQPGV